MTPVGLVLAAGGGRRFGRPKALVELDGRTLLSRAVDALVGGGCQRVVAVVHPSVREVPPGTEAVPNPRWEEGQGSSLRLGLSACAGAGAAVVTLVDTPAVTAEHVRRLAAAWRAGAVAAVAAYDGRPRTPVLLAAEVWAEVSALAEGDLGARAWLRAHAALVRTVECGDLGPWLDVDTPEDLQRHPPR